MQRNYFFATDASLLTGVSIRKILYWSETGLLKRHGDSCMLSRKEIIKILLIDGLRNIGYSLKEIVKSSLDIPNIGDLEGKRFMVILHKKFSKKVTEIEYFIGDFQVGCGKFNAHFINLDWPRETRKPLIMR